MADQLTTRIRAKRGAARVGRLARRCLGLHQTDDVKQKMETYRRYWEEAAGVLCAEFVTLSEGFWEVRLSGRSARIHGWHVQLGDPVAIAIAQNKPLCYQYAISCGVPVPPHGVYRLGELSRAKSLIVQRPGIYLVKPTSGAFSGVGITTHVRTPGQLENAAVAASFFTEEFLLEQLMFGESFRLLFLDGELVHAVRRRGLWVTGDGCSTIAELLAGQGQRKVAFDLTTFGTLQAQGLFPHSVPANGQEVLARSLPVDLNTEEPSRKSHDEKVTHLICPAIIQPVGHLLAALGCRIAGVDIVTTNPAVSLNESGGVLLEVNPTPGIHRHYVSPEEHGPKGVGVKVLRYLLQESSHTPTEPVFATVRSEGDRRTTFVRN